MALDEMSFIAHCCSIIHRDNACAMNLPSSLSEATGLLHGGGQTILVFPIAIIPQLYRVSNLNVALAQEKWEVRSYSKVHMHTHQRMCASQSFNDQGFTVEL